MEHERAGIARGRPPRFRCGSRHGEPGRRVHRSDQGLSVAAWAWPVGEASWCEPGDRSWRGLRALGPNRAGKTTLLKILLGLCRPGGGRVSRLGRPLSDRGTLRPVGYLHENQAFPGYLMPLGTAGTLRGALGPRAALWVRFRSCWSGSAWPTASRAHRPVQQGHGAAPWRGAGPAGRS